MERLASTRLRGWIGSALALSWWPGGLAYMVYSTATATGPGGWLMDQQMRWFDAASTKATVFLLFVAWLLIGLLGHGAWEWAFGSDDTPALVRARLRDEPPPIRSAQRAWARLALAGVALAVGGLALHLVLPQHDAVEQRETVHRIDLLSEPSAELDGKRFAQVSAVARHEHAFLYSEGKTHRRHHIVPLVGADWTPDQPVRLVLDAGEHPPGRALQQMPVELSRNDLPAYATGALARRGLKLAEPYHVARPADLQR